MMQESQTAEATRRPTISFQGKDKCVNVGKDVIRLLGNPAFIGLFLSEDGESLAISPCSEKKALSFAVPKDFLSRSKVQFRIHSKQFVEDILLSARLDKDRTYRLEGTFIPELNMVTFQLSEFQGLAKDRIIVLCSEEEDDFPDEDEFPVE